MAGVFVSYKRGDEALVERLVTALRGAGLAVWWDKDIAPDAPWEDTIERELQAAKAVIVAWSKASVDSENVKAEARRARAQGKLVQCYIEACEAPLFFGERQGVDLSDWRGDAQDRRFQTVAAAARALIEGRAPAVAVATAPRKRAKWPLAAGATALVAAILIGIALFGFPGGQIAREAETPIASDGDVAASAAPAPSSSLAPSAASTPALTPGQPHRLDIAPGSAVDFDSGAVSTAITDASDFVLTGRAADGFSIATANDGALIGVAASGPATPAACGTELTRPTISWQIPMANDVGEIQCFRTNAGREGALTLERGRAGYDGAVVTILLWP
ncbi:MAG: TIR domain-containing protein [Alphaproteobacteria bacterium]|nr:TIR domain-containing protein [Alphaproteobacteria bacterium]